MELFDQGKQPKFVHVPGRFGPLEFAIWVQVMCLGDEGVMEMMNGDGVPGVAGQGACNEAARVVEVSGEAIPENILRIPARVRYQTRLTGNLVAVAVITVKRSNEK